MTGKPKPTGAVLGIALLAIGGLVAVTLGVLSVVHGFGTHPSPSTVSSARGTSLVAFLIGDGVVLLALAAVLAVGSVRERLALWWYLRRHRTPPEGSGRTGSTGPHDS